MTDYMQEVSRILDSAKQSDIILRLLGSTAFRIHCPNHLTYLDSMHRELTDIDLMSISNQRKKVKELFKTLGYQIDQQVLLESEGRRYAFAHPTNNVGVDVFFDKLDMCHTIGFKDRLDVDEPTIPLAELILEKMQIVKINPKDIKDTIVLLMEHQIGNGDKETINSKFIVKLLSHDWGFYYTLTTNLKKVQRELQIPSYAVIPEEKRRDVDSKINMLLDEIEREPKSLGWKLRAKIGTSKQWYHDVELEKRTAFQD